MAYSDIEKSKIDTFFSACDDLIGGKFILSDIKITAILKTIATSDTLYNLFSQCMNGFNFAEEFNLATNNDSKRKFDMPTDDSKIVAFVFCLLLQVDNKKIKLPNFVKDYFFSPDGYNISYANFAKVVLIPFKQAMHRFLDEPEEEYDTEDSNDDYVPDGQPQQDEDVEDNKTIDDELNDLTNRMFEDVQYYVEKIKTEFPQVWTNKKTYNEVDITIRALSEACDIRNYLIMNALVSALEHQVSGKKQLKLLVLEIENIIAKYHYTIKKGY